jgi:hypothetical protein
MESNMTTNHGNPAFPVGTQYLGMMLRDYFAAQAMQGMISASGNSNGYLEYEEETVAANAYKLADAMLKARSK